MEFRKRLRIEIDVHSSTLSGVSVDAGFSENLDDGAREHWHSINSWHSEYGDGFSPHSGEVLNTVAHYLHDDLQSMIDECWAQVLSFNDGAEYPKKFNQIKSLSELENLKKLDLPTTPSEGALAAGYKHLWQQARRTRDPEIDLSIIWRVMLKAMTKNGN